MPVVQEAVQAILELEMAECLQTAMQPLNGDCCLERGLAIKTRRAASVNRIMRQD